MEAVQISWIQLKPFCFAVFFFQFGTDLAVRIFGTSSMGCSLDSWCFSSRDNVELSVITIGLRYDCLKQANKEWTDLWFGLAPSIWFRCAFGWYDKTCYDVVWYDMIWYDMIWCDVMWCDVMWCDVMWCDMIWYDMMWCDVMWCDVMWYDMIWYDMMPSENGGLRLESNSVKWYHLKNPSETIV